MIFDAPNLKYNYGNRIFGQKNIVGLNKYTTQKYIQEQEINYSSILLRRD